MRKVVLIIILFVLFVGNYLVEAVPFNLFFSSSNVDSDLIVLCYNVKCSSPFYKENQKYIAREIINESPDVAFLCEFNLWPSKTLDSIMINEGGYKRFYKSGSYCVFYSKYSIDSIKSIDTGTFRNGHSLNNMIHLYLPNDTLSVIGCHLSSSKRSLMRAYRNRIIETDSIIKAIQQEAYPLIVMGDLNDISGSYTIRNLKKQGLKNAWWEGGSGYGCTFHDKWLRLRLDHILYSKDKLKLQFVKVIDSDLSDHNALVAGFSFHK